MLQHVLPKGFVKIRHAGLYAAGNVNTRLIAARTLLEGEGAGPAERDAEQGGSVDLAAIIAELSALPDVVCPQCGARVESHVALAVPPKSRAPPVGPPS